MTTNRMGLDNENPTLFNKSEERNISEKDWDDNEAEEFDSREIFGIFKIINIHESLVLI